MCSSTERIAVSPLPGPRRWGKVVVIVQWRLLGSGMHPIAAGASHGHLLGTIVVPIWWDSALWRHGPVRCPAVRARSAGLVGWIDMLWGRHSIPSWWCTIARRWNAIRAWGRMSNPHWRSWSSPVAISRWSRGLIKHGQDVIRGASDGLHRLMLWLLCRLCRGREKVIEFTRGGCLLHSRSSTRGTPIAIAATTIAFKEEKRILRSSRSHGGRRCERVV